MSRYSNCEVGGKQKQGTLSVRKWLEMAAIHEKYMWFQIRTRLLNDMMRKQNFLYGSLYLPLEKKKEIKKGKLKFQISI